MALNTNKLENKGLSIIENGASAITNTTTETTLFTTTVKGGSMGISKIARFNLISHITTPALSIPNLTIKIYLGTAVTTLISAGSLGISISDKPFNINGGIANMNATNIQYMWANIVNNSTTGLILSSLGVTTLVTDGTWATDTTVDQTFKITATWGALSTTASITAKIMDFNLS